MTTVSVASGKGGAGKTSIAAALASILGPGCVCADCDVDAANGAIALGASVREGEPYFAGPAYRIEAHACDECGRCVPACRFGAIKKASGESAYRIVAELCERCGACVDACSTGAIVTYEKQAGELFVSGTRVGMPLVHAELVPGEDTSGKLVRKIRERAERLAGETSVIVVDSPPGIGCPVIASLSGSDLVVIVVEASASGIRDADRLMELVASMRRRSIAIINKVGLDEGMDARARELVAGAGIPLAGEIAFDPALRSAEESGKTWLSVECRASAGVASVLNAVKAAISILARRSGNEIRITHG
jgi:MinD superfamily P-loop ATPase